MTVTVMTHDAASSRAATGLVLALASATSFGMSGVLARGLLDTGWSAGAAVTVRTLIAAVVLVVPGALALRGRWHLMRANAGLITVYGLSAVAGAQLCYFYAVTYMQVSVALLLEYTAPVAVVLWLWLRHGHRPSGLTVIGAAIAASGLVLVLDVMLPISLAAGGLLVAGIVLALAGAVGVLPFHVATAPAVYDGHTVAWWVPVLALGLVTAAFAYVTGIEAGRRLGSRLASFVALGEVLAAVIFAWLLLGELPRVIQMAGGLLVLAGVVVVKLGEGRAPLVVEPLPEPEPELVSERPAA